MRRRHVRESGLARKPIDAEPFVVDRAGHEPRPVAGENERRALVAGVLHDRPDARRHEHAGHEVQALLATGHDDDLIRIGPDAAREPQMIGDGDAKLPQAGRVSVAHERASRPGEAVDDELVPDAHRKERRVRLAHPEVVDEPSGERIVDARAAAPEGHGLAGGRRRLGLARAPGGRRDPPERGRRLATHHGAGRGLDLEDPLGDQQIVRQRDRVARDAELLREGSRRGNAARRREDALVDELTDLVGDLRLQRLERVPSDRER